MFILKPLILQSLLSISLVFGFSNITDLLEINHDRLQDLLKIGELISSDDKFDLQLEDSYNFNSILFEVSPIRAFATFSGGLAQLPRSIISHGICLWKNIYEETEIMLPISPIAITPIKFSLLSECDSALMDLAETVVFQTRVFSKEEFENICTKTLSCIKEGNIVENVTELFDYNSELSTLRYPGGDTEKISLLEQITANRNITEYNIIRCFLFIGDLRYLRHNIIKTYSLDSENSLESDIKLFKHILSAGEENYSRGGSGGFIPIIRSCMEEFLKIAGEENLSLIEEMCSITFSPISNSLTRFSSMSILKLYNDFLEKNEIHREEDVDSELDNEIDENSSKKEAIIFSENKNETYTGDE